MEGLVGELKNITAKSDVGDDYLVMNSKYVPLKIEPKNFHRISGQEPSDKPSGNILFVDGGNSLLFDSAAFCIGFIKVGCILYSGNKRVRRHSEEFYVLVKESDGKYLVRTYPGTSFDNMAFDPEDESLRSGMEKCDITRIISILRRFAEIEHAHRHSSDADYIIMDGTLESRYPYEDKYLSKLLSTRKACALSKTCGLITRNGMSVVKKLFDMGLGQYNDFWYYNPIVTNNNPLHDAEIYFVKLNSRSQHVFRFEVQKGFKGDVEGLFLQLASNSSDPIFLGYPYGLIDVDQYARVSDEESRLLQTKLSVKLGKEWNEFSKHLSSTNAHSILDKIRF